MMPLRCCSDEKAMPFESSLTTNTSMHVCKKARERERELLLSLIATRWIVEAGEVNGDGGGG